MIVAAAVLFTLSQAQQGRVEGLHRPDPAHEAARFLWSKQAADGGWHSERYGLLRSGQSLTPFVLTALLEAPEELRPKGAVDRAVRFIRNRINRDGALGLSDPTVADYPIYATSLGVRVLRRKEIRDRLVACLKRHQFQESLGWKPADPPYGAWGMGGPLRRAPHPGHVDLPMTRHALEALRDGGTPHDDPAFARAQRYLRRCQNPDGGFFFSTVVLPGNKAGRADGRFRSYGTATADGILALLASGVPATDGRVRSALAWLVKHHLTDRVPGIPDEIRDTWRSGMVFYYLAASARVFHRLDVRDVRWKEPLLDALRARQRKDGGFANESFIMKEDDPLIATPLALTALLMARRGK